MTGEVDSFLENRIKDWEVETPFCAPLLHEASMQLQPSSTWTGESLVLQLPRVASDCYSTVILWTTSILNE